MEYLIKGFRQQQKKVKVSDLELAFYRFLETVSESDWNRLKPEALVDLMECRFKSYQNGGDEHQIFLYNAIKQSPELLQNVIQQIGLRHQGYLNPYRKFLAEVFS